MRKTPYYSVRTGRHPTGGKFDLGDLKRLFLALYNDFEAHGMFQQFLGYECVDAGQINGTAGSDVEGFFFRKLRKCSLWPIGEAISNYSEDDLFDVIELLHDCSSKGVDGQFHSFANCGWHYETFDNDAGQNAYRLGVNEIIREYKEGFELTTDGETVEIAPHGLADLEIAPAPPGHPDAVQARVGAAISKFRRRGSTRDDRRDAVRDLADILEFLRPQAKAVLASKDEADLFEIANKFGIRHHNQKQKSDYDHAIWQSWMFYYYLATVHATTRLIAKGTVPDRVALRPRSGLELTKRC